MLCRAVGRRACRCKLRVEVCVTAMRQAYVYFDRLEAEDQLEPKKWKGLTKYWDISICLVIDSKIIM